MNEINMSFLNPVKNRFLPLPRSAVEGLEHEPTINDFEITKELGTGSFGSVFLANHKKTKAQYAIKMIDKTIPENLEEKANFNREVEIMYKLNHPNIVKLYGHFEDSQYCYFVMQFIPKRDVFELIPRPGQKPNLKLIASVMKDLISAVYYLHNMKPTIIHRDIKPENILLDENSKAYLTDFGWSNYRIGDRRRNTVCGTPLYLPPEMVGEFGHDETADIWCIGVLLFELITGITPFGGIDFETVKYNISRLNINWPRVMDPDAKDLCSKILKLNGKDRLPIEQILKHNFFTKFFPNAVNELIKPEGQKYKIFVMSKDDPKTWNQQNKQNSSSNTTPSLSYNKNNNVNNINKNANLKNNIKTDNNLNKNNNSNLKYKKITYNNKNKENKEISGAKSKAAYIPRANIDLSISTRNERDINSSYNKSRSGNIQNSSYNKYNSSNINKSFAGSNNNDNRHKNIIVNSFNSSNKYRNSYKVSSINNSTYNSNNSNYNSNDKYRNSFKYNNNSIRNTSYTSNYNNNDKYRNSVKYNNNSITISTNKNMNNNNTTNYNKNFKHSNTSNYNYNNTDSNNITRGQSQNINFYSSYNYKK